jgi:hypothetical protein
MELAEIDQYSNLQKRTSVKMRLQDIWFHVSVELHGSVLISSACLVTGLGVKLTMMLGCDFGVLCASY